MYLVESISFLILAFFERRFIGWVSLGSKRVKIVFPSVVSNQILTFAEFDKIMSGKVFATYSKLPQPN